MTTDIPHRQPEGFETHAPVHPLIAARWSPRDFDPVAEVTPTQLRSVLEAARWAPSWGGTAPARFVAGLRGSRTHTELSALLAPGNAWAGYAGALVLGLAQESNEKGELPYGPFDLGAAVTQAQLQAVAEGLVAHPMAGFDAEGARPAFAVPEGFRPWVMLAIGHSAEERDDDPRGELAGRVRERDATPRRRPAFDEMVYGGPWGTPLED